MKSINWPQAYLDTPNRAMLVQASWYDYELDLGEVTFPVGDQEDEVKRFMSWLFVQELWGEVDRREHAEWGVSVWGLDDMAMAGSQRKMRLRAQKFRTGSDELGGVYYDESNNVSAEILSNIRNFLEESWEGEWEIHMWHDDPTFELHIKKIGEGMLYA